MTTPTPSEAGAFPAGMRATLRDAGYSHAEIDAAIAGARQEGIESVRVSLWAAWKDDVNRVEFPMSEWVQAAHAFMSSVDRICAEAKATSAPDAVAAAKREATR